MRYGGGERQFGDRSDENPRVLKPLEEVTCFKVSSFVFFSFGFCLLNSYLKHWVVGCGVSF